MEERQSVSVDVVSDVVCPWCYVGLKRLETARAQLPDLDVAVRWRPYQLDPTIPQGGVDRRAYMINKFGSEERIRQIHARIKPLGEAEGIRFAFDAIKVSPNTLDAHLLLRWAGAIGNEVQNDLKRRLMQLYFEEGADIGDHAVLIDAATASGMDGSIVVAMLPTDADRAEVREEIATASRMGITGVPCFLLEGKYAVMGAQDAGTLADAIRQIAAEKALGGVRPV